MIGAFYDRHRGAIAAMLLLVMPINSPVQACIPMTESGSVTASMLHFGAAMMSLDVHRCAKPLFCVALVMCSTVTACMLAWPVDLHFGSIY